MKHGLLLYLAVFLVIVARTTKNAIFKNHLKNILCE